MIYLIQYLPLWFHLYQLFGENSTEQGWQQLLQFEHYLFED